MKSVNRELIPTSDVVGAATGIVKYSKAVTGYATALSSLSHVLLLAESWEDVGISKTEVTVLRGLNIGDRVPTGYCQNEERSGVGAEEVSSRDGHDEEQKSQPDRL